ncbi:MAG: GIY-YIG nuclease family protein [Pseudanabaenaceae cyanobacterium]
MTYPHLADLPLYPYLTQAGLIDGTLEGKRGVYAIFDGEVSLAYVGISRNIATSLQQHLVRVPDRCHFYKVWTMDTWDRDLLEQIQNHWQGDLVIDRDKWEKPIDCRLLLTPEEQENLQRAEDEIAVNRVLKGAARRVEQEILQKLAARGVKFAVCFHPKRKEEGLLDLKLY